jgi:hypothetical protein
VCSGKVLKTVEAFGNPAGAASAPHLRSVLAKADAAVPIEVPRGAHTRTSINIHVV